MLSWERPPAGAGPGWRRVACLAPYPFHRRVMDPIAAACPNGAVLDSFDDAIAFRPDVLVMAEASPIPSIRAACDARGVLILAMRHGAANKYIAPEAEYGLADFVCASDWDVRDFSSYGIAPRLGFLLTGNPWLDDVFRIPRRPPRTERPVVLFAPTYNPETSAARFFGDRLVSSIREVLPTARIVIKPHPAVFHADVPHLAPYAEEFSAWLASWRRAATDPGVEFVDDPGLPAAAFFDDSDLLITDASSVMFEYMLLERPILLYTSGGKVPFWTYDAAAPGLAWRDIGSEFCDAGEFTLSLASIWRDHATKAIHAQRRYRRDMFGGFDDGRARERLVGLLGRLPWTEVLLPRGGASDTRLLPSAERLARDLANSRLSWIDSAEAEVGRALNAALEVSSAETVLLGDPAATLLDAIPVAAARRCLLEDPTLGGAGQITWSPASGIDGTSATTADGLRRMRDAVVGGPPDAARAVPVVRRSWFLARTRTLRAVGGIPETGADGDAWFSLRLAGSRERVLDAWSDELLVAPGPGVHDDEGGWRWLADEAEILVSRTVARRTIETTLVLELALGPADCYPALPLACTLDADGVPLGRLELSQGQPLGRVELLLGGPRTSIRIRSSCWFSGRQRGLNLDERRLAVRLIAVRSLERCAVTT